MGWWNVSTHKQTNLLNCELKTSTFRLKMDQMATKQLNHNQCSKPPKNVLLSSHEQMIWYDSYLKDSHYHIIIPGSVKYGQRDATPAKPTPTSTNQTSKQTCCHSTTCRYSVSRLFKNKAKGFVAFCTRPRAFCNIVGFRRFLLDTFPLTTLEAAFVCFFDFEDTASTPNSAFSSSLKSARRGPGDCGATGDERSGESCPLGVSSFSCSKGESLDCEPEAIFSGCFPVSRSFRFDKSTMAWSQVRRQPTEKKCCAHAASDMNNS